MLRSFLAYAFLAVVVFGYTVVALNTLEFVGWAGQARLDQ